MGSTISHYKILEKLGQGGMGVVYKAEDTQLRRTVALKFLSSETVDNEEIKARLIREAQAAASLDHPNICQVFGIHEEDGKTFIAMAYIDGPSLADKIKERPLPLDEALDIAVHIAEGLQEAHEKGIVHRDIKPQNVMLTAKRQVKIMDFGLAAVAGRSRLTKSGTTLGTPAYMAPEQLEAKEADRRADIWALGCVLYETLTQRTPFEAEYEQAIAYGILNEEPEPVTARRSGIPVDLDRVIGKTLAKSPEHRYQHADELTVDLRELAEVRQPRQAEYPPGADITGPFQASAEKVFSKRKERALYGLLAATTLFSLVISIIHFGELAPREPPLRRFGLRPLESLGLPPRSAAISPNGEYLVYATTEQRVDPGTTTWAGSGGRLWRQDLAREEPRPIERSEGAVSPFWSPDSVSIGFAADGALKTVSVDFGSVIQVCDLPNSSFSGGVWNSDGDSIIFASGTPRAFYEVAARGGTPERILAPDESERTYAGIYWPHLLPAEAGSRTLVFAFGPTGAQQMMVKDLVTGQAEALGPGNFPFFSPTGHLLYQPSYSTHEVWAMPFSLETLTATGESFRVSENGRGPTVAVDGTMVYADGLSEEQYRLVWLDRDRKKISEAFQAQGFSELALSPDGKLDALSTIENDNQDLWAWDIARAVRTRLVSSPFRDFSPVWSPDGRQLAFSSTRAGNPDIYLVDADGISEEKLLTSTALPERVTDWSQDAEHILYVLVHPETKGDIWLLERDEQDGDWTSRPFLQTADYEEEGRFSPDGRYVAYLSDESGRSEVYVRTFPAGDQKWTVSSNGATGLRWSRDGGELFFVERNALMSVTVSTRPEFSVGPLAQRLIGHVGGQSYPRYDVSADGSRVLFAEMMGAGEEGAEPMIRIVQNWHQAFLDREPD